MLNLISRGSYFARNEQWFIVDNPITCYNFDYLMNTRIYLDEVEKLVTKIEKFAHHPPWKEGESISIFVQDVKSTTNIRVIKKHKKEAEQTIVNTLNKLHQQTGCRIYGIDWNSILSITNDQKIISVDIDLRL